MARTPNGSELKVKQLVRWLSRNNIDNPDAGVFSVGTVDAELSSWVAAGYRITGTHYVGANDLAYGVLYILTHD